MYKRRILIVDDLPDLRVTLTRLLAMKGYTVRAAGSMDEALEMLAQERFHVAVLDQCLDQDNTESNKDGLRIAQEIQDHYPPTVVIMLTGYATVTTVTEALQPDQTGQTLAYRYLEKGVDAFDRLIEIVDEAFRSKLKINDTVEIQDQSEFIPLICTRMRFPSASAPPSEQLAEEVEELVRKLFFECTRVEHELIRGGYSGVAVCKFTPWYPTRGRGEIVIAKLGDAQLIESEVDNYRRHVRGIVGGNRVPNVLKTARTHSLAGVLYTLAGLDAPQDFTSFYQQANPPQLEETLRNLFLDTCFPSRFESGYTSRAHDLCSTYVELLNLRPDKLQNCLDKTMGKHHPFRKDEDGQRIWLDGEIALVNPVQFALSTDLKADSFTCIIHGDLHGYHVIVDRFGAAWMIDFANTREGPLIQDYASFETYLRVSMIRCKDWRALYEWNRALFEAEDLHKVPLPETLASHPDICKAHHSILVVRELAYEASSEDMQRAYLIGLLFTALKILTIMNLPRDQRDHALISAALIAQRLQ